MGAGRGSGTEASAGRGALREREGLHRAPAAEPWADRACHVKDERSDAAARARELLARQVRDGEISVVCYKAGPGYAAVLAATLAVVGRCLHGRRRRRQPLR